MTTIDQITDQADRPGGSGGSTGREDAERRAGELLREMEKNRGAATPLRDERASAPTLQDLGINYTQSHRWQTIASLPEEAFEAHLAQDYPEPRQIRPR